MTCALMYHDVVAAGAEDTSGFPGRDAALYKVTPSLFDSHLDAIGRAHNAGAPVPLFTFDDGGASAMWVADRLERRNLRGYFLVTANYVNTPGFLEAAEIRALHARGHFVGSHSCTHPLRMAHCSRRRLLEEWRVSHARLSDLVSAPIGAASIPGGDYSRAVAEAAAEAGFTLLFTSEPTRTTRQIGSLTIQGRFTIQRWTSAQTAAALASGAWLAAARQAVAWNAKKITKRIGGRGYLHIRQLLLGHGNEVRWGDRV